MATGKGIEKTKTLSKNPPLFTGYENDKKKKKTTVHIPGKLKKKKRQGSNNG